MKNAGSCARRSASKLCEEYGLLPTAFYRRQQQFFENGAAAFDREVNGAQRAAERKLSALEAKLARKNEVVCELMEEHVKSRKRTW